LALLNIKNARAKLASLIAPAEMKAASEQNGATRGDQLPPYVDGLPYTHAHEMSLAETIRKVKTSPVTLGCINAYVRRIQQLTFRIQAWSPDSRRYEFVHEDHPAEERWDQPADWLTAKEMASMFCFSMFGTGNWLASHISSDRNDKKNRARTLEIHPLDPDFVDPIMDVLDVISDYWIRKGDPRSSTIHLLSALGGIRYQYHPLATNQGRPVPRKQMIHCKFATNKVPWWGLSPIETAALAIDTGSVAQAWNRVMIGNRFEEGGVLETELPLGREDIAELKAQVRAQIGGANAGDPIILTRGLKWTSTSRPPKEMDYVGTDKRVDWKICAALGVHPVVLGQLDDATLNNVEALKRDFWMDSVIPLVELWMDSVNTSWVWPTWGRDVRLWYDASNVLALQEKREEKVQVFTALHDRGYPANMLNAWLELGLPELPVIGDKSFIKAGLTEVADENRVEYAEGEIVDGEDVQPALEAGDEQAPKLLLRAPEYKGFPDSAESRDAFWFSFEKARTHFYARWEQRLSKLLTEDLAVAAAEAEGGLAAVGNALDLRTARWEQELTKLWTEVAQAFGERTADQIEAKDGYGANEVKAGWSWGRDAAAYVRDLAKIKAKAIIETTKTWLGRRHDQTIGQGQGADEFDEAVREQGPEYVKWRREMISRTETISASNYGAREAAVQSGRVTAKIWLTARDDRVRDTHQALEGQKRPLDQPYSNGLMFPGDPSGPLSEICACRCVELYEV
jgi:phage portal protein BeeE